MKFTKILATILWGCGLAACSGNTPQPTGEEDVAQETKDKDEQGIISLRERKGNGLHSIANTKLEYSFTLKADKKLSVVVNRMEERFYDNRAKVVITTPNGKKTEVSITKENLRQYIPEQIYGTSGLIGFCFNQERKQDNTGLYFIATIGDPDETADISYALELVMKADGTYQVHELKDKETYPIKRGMTIDPNEPFDEIDAEKESI